MPRLPTSLLLKAHRISPLLPLVLRGTRTLESAINELRWLKEHVSTTKSGLSREGQRRELLGLCVRRSRAEPLQYILGSQPFGELDIKCRRSVLIPRPETEAYTFHVANLLLNNKIEKLANLESLKILDVCSGSGCISLLLHSLIAPRFKHVSVLGVDISPIAIALARENLSHNIRQGNFQAEANSQIHFKMGDVLTSYPNRFETFDIIISNPPYISPTKFVTETSRSVRNYEPSLALVPPINPLSHTQLKDRGICEPEDVFYRRLCNFFRKYESKLLVMEVGDEEQARRIVQMAITKFRRKMRRGTVAIEVWRDWPGGKAEVGEDTTMRIEGKDFTTEGLDFEVRAGVGRTLSQRTTLIIPIMGTGAMRTVVLFRTKNIKERNLENELLAKRETLNTDSIG